MCEKCWRDRLVRSTSSSFTFPSVLFYPTFIYLATFLHEASLCVLACLCVYVWWIVPSVWPAALAVFSLQGQECVRACVKTYKTCKYRTLWTELCTLAYCKHYNIVIYNFGMLHTNHINAQVAEQWKLAYTLATSQQSKQIFYASVCDFIHFEFTAWIKVIL